MEPIEIRLVIRAKLRYGRLPLDAAPTALGLPGDGQKCGACDEVIAADSLMMQISPPSSDKRIVLHADCYILWNEERRTAR